MQTYYWPKMQADADRFVKNCHVCQRSRTARHAPFGILHPLPILDRPWQDIVMDFITGLPWSQGHDAIWVVIDRLTKARHFVPYRTNVDAKDLADLFIEHVFRLHGLPYSVVSDRGPQFAAAFWKRLCNRLGIDGHLSSAFNPESDSQTERVNAIMEQCLRAHVYYLAPSCRVCRQQPGIRVAWRISVLQDVRTGPEVAVRSHTTRRQRRR